MSEGEELDNWQRQAQAGDGQALERLLDHYRDRLAGMIRLRLDRRLSGRVDLSSVLEEVWAEARQRFVEYRPENLPFYLWLRQLAGQKLADIQRRHLGAQARDAAIEVSLYRGAPPP